MKKDRTIWVSLAAIIFVGIFWCGTWSMLPKWGGGSYKRASYIGEMFGAVTALFSGLAFVGVAVAAYSQHRLWKQEREKNESECLPIFRVHTDRQNDPPVETRSNNSKILILINYGKEVYDIAIEVCSSGNYSGPEIIGTWRKCEKHEFIIDPKEGSITAPTIEKISVSFTTIVGQRRSVVFNEKSVLPFDKYIKSYPIRDRNGRIGSGRVVSRLFTNWKANRCGQATDE